MLLDKVFCIDNFFLKTSWECLELDRYPPDLGLGLEFGLGLIATGPRVRVRVWVMVKVDTHWTWQD